MHALTAVAPQEQQHEDAECIVVPETGFFIMHSRTRIYSQINYNNMLLNNRNILLLIMCLISLCFTAQCTRTYAARIEWGDLEHVKAPAPIHECPTIGMRRSCQSFEEIKNCTVILGSVIIAAIHSDECNFTNLVFPYLTEITDYLLISNVPNLKSIKTMFPSLIVIRGRRIFTNYAMLLDNCENLVDAEFKSLIALQRGNVLMVRCPKLCSTSKINFDRLTLSRGKNNIFLNESNECPPNEIHCIGCKSDSCWSNNECQKFETDSVISPMQDPSECHKECLGGCYNRTAQGCAVCRGYTDHGTCVSQCPRDKYTSSHHLRCYTREECADKKFYIFKHDCVDFCPVGYKENNATMECDLCSDPEKCKRLCDVELYDITVANIDEAQRLRGCETVNGSIVIDIYEHFDPSELIEHLQDIKEITGYLKIHRSPFLTSLNFFKNLEKIHGNVLEYRQYAVIIYNNKNLTELWDVKPGFEIVNGGLYIHANDKLCTRLIRLFRQSIKHDNSRDSIQKTDEEVFCAPAILNLYLRIKDHRSISLHWPKDQTYSEVEILYRSVLFQEKLQEKSELDTDVCQRIKWHREWKYTHELLRNSTHYVYEIRNLEPHTRYAVFVKTFNRDNDAQEGRSEIKYGSTKFDIPTAPEMVLTGKRAHELDIEFSQGQVKSDGSRTIVDHFILEAYELKDDENVLDTRDYCDEPAMDFKENVHEDYDDCCSRREKGKRDKKFLSELKRDFACSLDNPQYCRPKQLDYKETAKRHMFFTHQIDGWETKYTLHLLKPYHLYVIQLKACNNVGCGSYSTLTARTNYSSKADSISFSFCRENDTYRVQFSEPPFPNGYITSYAVHLRNHTPNNNGMDSDQNVLVCVTRLEHVRHNYEYVAQSNHSFNQAAVRVHSLGLHTFIGWKNISNCSDLGTASILRHFLIGCLIFVIFVVLLLVYLKRRRIMSWLRDHGPVHSGWRFLRRRTYRGEDHHNLVRDFSTAIFYNRADERDEARNMIELRERVPDE